VSKNKRIKKLEQRVDILELVMKIDQAKERKSVPPYPVWYPVESNG